jgi:protein SERAC1
VSDSLANRRAELADHGGFSIVFVHGLRGHRRKAWTKNNVCWPEELLSKEEALSHIRILMFGYDAQVISLIGRASMNNLFEHSINLLNELSRERTQDAVSWS